MRSSIKNYLSITKKEWNGMVVLVVQIALVLAAPSATQLWRKDTIINLNDFNKAVDVLGRASKSQSNDGLAASLEQHGANAILDGMPNIPILNDEILRKIEPYIFLHDTAAN